jgi:hypothetical protein
MEILKFFQLEWIVNTFMHVHGDKGKIYPTITLFLMEPTLTLQLSCNLTGTFPSNDAQISQFIADVEKEEDKLVVSSYSNPTVMVGNCSAKVFYERNRTMSLTLLLF